MATDPLKITRDIKQSYKRYLTSTFRLRDNELRTLFHEMVEIFQFTNGPILEAIPPFKEGGHFRELIDDRFLLPQVFNLTSPYYYKGRQSNPMYFLEQKKLYLHQEKALRKILRGRNVVIASGTGSGKTECFLIPIYNHLLTEHQEGRLTPGVRALLLYPMNALANDQLRRIREIGRVMEERMPEVKITFGRYVGDTRETKRDGEEKFRLNNPGVEPINSELLSREEMRDNPPHILITNYAMLEYMLLRPDDSPFFDGEYAGHWKFLVLDEAHIYSGATGIEVAMLIRRLKDRVCKNMEGELQCIATSATLVKEDEDFKKVADFATNLFGEKFKWLPLDQNRQDIIKGERIKTTVESQSFRYPIEIYSALDKMIQENIEDSSLNKYFNLCQEYGVPNELLNRSKEQSRNDAKRFLYEILSKDEKIKELKNILEEGAINFDECLKKIIGNNEPTDEQLKHFISMINVAVWARPHTESLPLISTRYHLFVRAPEGIFVSFYPEPKIFLDRREKTETGNPVFELASCRRCGQEYLIGDVRDQKLTHSFSEIDRDKKNRFFLLWKDETEIEDDQDQEVAVPEEITEKGEVWKLCTKCGTISEKKPVCACNHEDGSMRTLFEITVKNANLNKCHLCGLRSANIVREFIFQKDAPAAVLITAMYQSLNKTKEKKILSFSDSRQDAAFFAPYLEFTYKRILFRQLIIAALRQNATIKDYRLNSLCEDVLKIAQEKSLFETDLDVKERKKEVWKWILQDFFGTWDRRNSLEGVGLVSFVPVVPQGWKPIKEIQEPPWNLTEDEAVWVYKTVINTFRFNNAVTFPEDGPSPEDEFFAPRNREYRFRGEGPDSKKRIYSFIPATSRLNARLEYIVKLYKEITGQNDAYEQSKKLLCKIWDDVCDKWKDEGLCQFSDPKQGVLYRLDHRYWRIVQESDDTFWYICNLCGAISSENVRGVCPTFNCKGDVVPFDEQVRDHLSRNHYRFLYTGSLLSHKV